MAEQHFAVSLKRSAAGRPKDQIGTLHGIGLRRMGKTVYLKDNPAIRGMLYKLHHLLKVEKRNGPVPAKD